MDVAMALPRQQRLRALMSSDTFHAWCRGIHLEEYDMRYFTEVISREIEWRVEEFLPRTASIKLTDLKSEDERELKMVHRYIETMREEWYNAREMVWKSRNSRDIRGEFISGLLKMIWAETLEDNTVADLNERITKPLGK
jgi:hypothetical protein